MMHYSILFTIINQKPPFYSNGLADTEPQLIYTMKGIKLSSLLSPHVISLVLDFCSQRLPRISERHGCWGQHAKNET